MGMGAIYDIEAGTDIAMVGLWDPASDGRPELSHKELMPFLEAEAREGKLLLMITGGDGSYRAKVYVGERPAEASLAFFDRLGGEFYIESQSGKLIFGGVEDYRHAEPRITSEEDCFEVAAGCYSVDVFECTLRVGGEDYYNELARRTSPEDVEHFRDASDGCASGCVLILIGILLGYFFSWWWLLAGGVLGTAVANWSLRRQMADEVYQRVARAAMVLDGELPEVIFVLDRVETMGESAGSFSLTGDGAVRAPRK